MSRANNLDNTHTKAKYVMKTFMWLLPNRPTGGDPAWGRVSV